MRNQLVIWALCGLGLGLPATAAAAYLMKIERTIGNEPAYRSKTPRYCLLVFGPKADYRVWLVLDGDTLYVDRNGNGDLTEAGESTKPAERTSDPCHFVPVTITAPDGKTKEELRFDLSGWFDYSEGKESADLNPRVTVTWKGRTFGAWGDETGPCVWERKPEEALILHIDGPLQMGFEQDARFSLVPKGEGQFELYVGVGTKGLGKGSFVHLCDYDDAIPKDVHPTAVLEFPNTTPGGAPVRVRTVLKNRESSCRLYDTIQVEGAAAEGTVKIALTFDEWKAGKVAPATFELPIPAQKGK